MKNVCEKENIHTTGIVKDLAMISLSEWATFIDLINSAFDKTTITVVFFQNNIPIPPVEDRFKIMREYHISVIGGHKGITKTYALLAKDFY